MPFDEERSEHQALDALEGMLQAVADELAEWRHRALGAEQELEALQGRPVAASGAVAGEDVAALAEQNRKLSARVRVAREKIGGLVQRLTFLEQQTGEGGPG